MCSRKTNHTAIPKGISYLCKQLQRKSPLGLMGTCECKEPQQKILCCHTQRWCYPYGTALLPSQKEWDYKEDEAWILNHGGKAISYAHFNRGGEFLSNEFSQHLKSKGTQCELTVHDSPPLNGVSERGMCTRGEETRTLLIASRLHVISGPKRWHTHVGSKIECLRKH